MPRQAPLESVQPSPMISKMITSIGKAGGGKPERKLGLDETRITQLRTFRSELQDLQRALTRVQCGDIPLRDLARYIQRTLIDIQPSIEMLPEIETCLGEDADIIRHARNTWESVADCPLLLEPDKKFDAQVQSCYLKELDNAFSEIIYQIGYLTIPRRLNKWLKTSYAGYIVPFHDVFSDEMPRLEDRSKLLKCLAIGPTVIDGGLVDSDSGLIYRYSFHQWAIWLAIPSLIGIFVLVAYLVLTSAYLNHFTIFGQGSFGIQGWPVTEDKQSIVFGSWLAILIGIVIHGAVGSAKRAQAQGTLPPVFSLWVLPKWANAKFGNILFKLGLTLVALGGFLYAVGLATPELGQAFLVGYSFDSFIELLSTGLEQRATAQVATLKQQLGVGEA